MYLVDTNVISASAPTKAARPDLIVWMEKRSSSLFLSAISIAEIVDGIAKSRREGASRKAADLSAWLDTVVHLYDDRILPVSSSVAMVAGALSDIARAQGANPGFADILIAATAKCHGLTILSRNIRHFAPLGVLCLDPFDGVPPG